MEKEVEFTDDTAILYTGATFSSFKDRKLLINKRMAENPIECKPTWGAE